MNLSISFYIALRYWRAKSTDRFGRLVTNLASFGIMLGVMSLIIVLSVMNGLELYQKQQVLSSIPHAIVSPPERISVKEPLISVPNLVQRAVPINTTSAVFQSTTGVSAGQIIGIQAFNDDPLLMQFDTNQFNRLLPADGFNLIIGYRLAQKLHLNIGDHIRLIITDNSQYTPFGRVPVQRLFTVSGIYYDSSEASSYEVFSNLSDIGRLMRIQPGLAQGYRLFLYDPFKITQLAKYFPSNMKITDWRLQKGIFFQAVHMEKNIMSLLISLIIVVAISNILTSLSLMVVDKQGEIAILQTQGITKLQVRSIFIYQGLLVGLVGTVIGTLLGIVIVLNLDKIIMLINPNGIFLPTDLEPVQIVAVMLFSLLSSFLSTIYPAYRATKIEPAEALRYE